MGNNKKGKKKDRERAQTSKVQPEVPKTTNEVSDANDMTGVGANQTLETGAQISTELSQTICSFCDLNLPGEWLVQCDVCDRHFHFNCVGYEATSNDDPWSCPECAGKILSSTAQSVAPTNKSPASQQGLNETVELHRQLTHDLMQEYRQRFEELSLRRQTIAKDLAVINPQKLSNGHARGTNRTVERNTEAEESSVIEVGDGKTADLEVNQHSVDKTDSQVAHKSSKAQSTSSVKTISSDVRTVHSSTRSVPSKISRSESSRASTEASSQRRRDITLQRLQEEYELQEKFDEQKMALERKALELKERREKKLMEEKYKAMEEIASDNGGSSVVTRVEQRRSAGMGVRTEASVHSERVSSWIGEQRRQNYKPQALAADVDPEKVTETLGTNISIPITDKELEQLSQQQGDTYQQYGPNVNSVNGHEASSLHSKDGTFTIRREKRSSAQLTSDTPAYHWNHNNPTSHTYDGRVNTRISNGQTIDSNRVVWSSRNSRPTQQSTQVRNPIVELNSGDKRSHRPMNDNGASSNLNRRPNKESTNDVGSSGQANANYNSKTQVNNHQPVRFSNLMQDPSNGNMPLLLSASQIASRHSMPKDLPHFYGHPQDWPQFIKRYENTTNLCGYTDCENLERLNKCLKDKAHRLVESLLVMPECVDEIIETLRDKFGRPELIAAATLEEVRLVPVIKQDKLETLCDFGYKVRNACNVIESMGLHYYLYNPELIQDIITKLPYATKIEWAKHAEKVQASNQSINLRTIAEWLHKLSRTLNQITTLDLDSLERSSDRRPERKTNNVKGYLNVHENRSTTSEIIKENPKCIACSSNCKSVDKCSKFKSLSPDDKWKLVMENKLCRKCLNRHGKNNCTAKVHECGTSGCQLKHNPLLHNEERHAKYRLDKANSGTQSTNPTSGNGKANNKQPASPSTLAPPKPSNTHQVIYDTELFRIAPVKLHNKGKIVKTFAFLDEGSSYTLMERTTADELEIEGKNESICLLWTNGIHRKEETTNVNVEISGIDNNGAKYEMRSVNVVDDLGLSPQTVDPDALRLKFQHLKEIPLPRYVNAVPTILIGMKHIRLTTPLETVEGDENQPIASRSRLGWTVYGPMGNSTTIGFTNHHKVSKCPCSDRDDELHQIIKEHFTIENFGVSINSMNMESKENQKALEMLKKFTVRKKDRFETRLLWKNEAYTLPDSYGMARKRLACVENKGETVVKIVDTIINDYIAKGYATKLSPDEVKEKHPRTFYLPIFTVTNPKKPAKIRPVFDAAATVKGTSLNSVLLTGPDMLSSLVDVLRRFREHKIAVVGDIEEMFYRVWINEEDRHSQRFLWRNGDKTREPDVYQFNVMTFGSKCSPSSAQFVKNANASEYELEFPAACNSIIRNHYVDDMLDGAESVEKAIQLIKDVKFVHSKAGFNIRNFKSNSQEVLKAIDEPNASSKVTLVEEKSNVERVLGMYWETNADCFMYSLQYTKVRPEVLQGKSIPTKRELLSLTMSLFDPLGLISYYVIHARILLQDVWRTKISWDEKLPEKLAEKWFRWVNLLPGVENLKIPRWYSTKLTPEKEQQNELHIFVDAGEDAFAAGAYLRVSDDEGTDCSLIGSKAKVTPLKYLSTPRKELLAAVLGARFINSVESGLALKINRRIIWSDSMTVLTWLQSESKKYSQFVAHRVGEILESTNLNDWRWVPSKLNVADEATKWEKKPTFDESERWFTGPQFLKRPEKEWPEQKIIIRNGTSEEMRMSCSHSKLIVPSIVNARLFSTWQRLVRAVANAKRISMWMVAKKRKLVLPTLKLAQEDLLDSEKRLIRQAQWEGYTEEMVTLTRNLLSNPKRQKPIDKGSPIKSCSPYLDEFGILRVRGRIDSATAVSEDAKRPIILPKDNPVTRLIVQSYHVRFKHQNHESVVNELRQRFYIPQVRAVVKSVRWNCKMCTLRRCKPQPPQMSDLPAIRFEAGTRPFTYTGIDLFGPMKVKIGRQQHKRWGVIYTCLTTRAIYIDVVPSLDTESCIMSIRDFVNRKGVVQEFYSDNGTNFKGADNELRKEMKKVDFQRLSDEFTSCYTKWRFNPPETPHMGGMWERLIQSVKNCLEVSMFTRTPTDQMLRSWLIEVENIVNSRPLTYVPIESEDDEALTPNHFLLGSSNGMKPPGSFRNDGPYLRQQWKEVQRCTNMFWKRFTNEYVPTLLRRSKWFDQVKPLEVGDLVIHFDANAPRNTYKRARVVETKMGKNNQVRRAKIQFANGSTLWRGVHHLGLLEVNPAPTESGLNHLRDDQNRGEIVGATTLVNCRESNVNSTGISIGPIGSSN